MALLWMDSFDHYATADLAKKYPVVGGNTWIGGYGRRSTNGLGFVGFNGQITTPTFTPGDATCVFGLAYRADYLSFNDIFHIRSGSNVQVQLGFSGGYAVAYRGAGSTLLGTAVTGQIVVNTFAYVEVKAVIHPSAGSVIVKIDGVEVLNLSSVNTAATGVAAWDNFNSRNAFGGVSYIFEDLYILDGSGAAPLNTFLGDCRVDPSYPTAEGAASAWTPLSGTDNALMIDETVPDNDTTYNATPTVGATDTHVVQDAAVAGAVIFGVQVCLDQKKTDAGTCTLAPVVRHSGTNYSGTAISPTTSYGYACRQHGTNPGTSAAWTEADFNAAEFGYTRTA